MTSVIQNGWPRIRKWSGCISLAICLYIILAHREAKANDTDFLGLSPEQLLGAEVTSASKRSESVSEAPAAIYVITHQDIERSGVTNIPDALRMAPGVDVAQTGSNSWAVNIRGFNRGLADQLLVMVDGRTVYNPLFAGTHWDTINIPMEDIERIEVIRGPGGTLWGANAVNGVINILTKKASETQGNLVSLGTGTWQKDSVLAQRGGTTGDDTSYRMYAQHFNDGSYQRPQGSTGDDDWQDSRIGFRTDHENLTVSGDAYTTYAQQVATVFQLAPPFSLTGADHIHSEGANLLAHWTNDFTDGAKLSLQSYFDYTSRNEVLLGDEEAIVDFDAQYNLAIHGRHEVIVGGGYRLTHQSVEDSPILSIAPANANRNLFNVFAQDKISLVPDKWFLILGSKVEHNDFTGFEFEPNVRTEWLPDRTQTFWASASRAVRTPSPFESDPTLLDAVIPPNTPPVNLPAPLEFVVGPNANFHSEQLLAYEAGYRNQVTPNFSVDATGFFNFYSGLAAQELETFTLVTPPLGAPFFLLETNQANLMSAETRGVEVAAQWNVAPNWKLSGSYSFLEMQLHLDPDFFNTQAEEHQSPENQANLRSYWNINRDLTFDTSLYYSSRLSAFNIPAYVRADVNLGWKIRPGLQFNLVGQNLLKSEHLEFSTPADLNATEVPRTAFAKLTWRF